MIERETVIIGGGPAGMAAAVQLQRYRLVPLLFEEAELGGLLRNAHLVENYLGFPEGISGMELVHLFKKQFEAGGIETRHESIQRLGFDLQSNCFHLETATELFSARNVIVATGTQARDFPGIDSVNPKLHGLVTSNFLALRNRKSATIEILGAGDAAFDYSLALGKTNDVFIISRSHRSPALPLLIERVGREPRIKVLKETVVERIEPGVEKGLALSLRQDQSLRSLEVDHLLVAIGRVPRKGFLSLDPETSEDQLVSRKRLFLVGDVRNGFLRQTSIAAGNGIAAAMQIGRKDEGVER